jgi:K+/H+ antiporter YhaU regulatory subunit KhtT
MRKLKVRQERLPGIGDRFELDTGGGLTITVVNHRSGRRDISLAERGAEVPLATAALSRAESVAVAALLTGLQIELITTART